MKEEMIQLPINNGSGVDLRYTGSERLDSGERTPSEKDRRKKKSGTKFVGGQSPSKKYNDPSGWDGNNSLYDRDHRSDQKKRQNHRWRTKNRWGPSQRESPKKTPKQASGSTFAEQAVC